MSNRHTRSTMFVILVCVAVISFLFVLYSTYQQKCRYWTKKKVPILKSVPIFGDFFDFIFLKKNVGTIVQKLCQKFPNSPYIGAYYGTEPVLIVQDPEIIKIVMVKDFYYFNGREISKYDVKELLTQNLFFTSGDKWKTMRQNLSPLFSSSKMKKMFHLIEKCSRVMESALDKEVKISNVMEVRALMSRFTMDCVGSCAFGVDVNTQEHKEGNPFNDIGEAIFDPSIERSVRIIVRSIWPAIFYGLGFKVFPKELEVFFFNLLTGIFEKRQYTPSPRNDFVDLMLKLWYSKEISGDSLKSKDFGKREKVNLEMNEDILVSQCFALFGAAYETSATTLGFTLYEIAKNYEVQEKIFQEIDSYLHRHDNVLEYESVAEMPYLEACVDEALRLYPVLLVLTREVMDDYVFPSGLKLEKGLRVFIPIYHLHYNPEYFPEPEKYKPERFYGDEKQNIKPYTYLPFGEGPRICIGMRFARMQMVAGLITLLKKYRVELAPGMKRKVELNISTMVAQAVGGLHLKFIEREGWEQRVLNSPPRLS